MFCDFTMTVSCTLFPCHQSLQQRFILMLTTYSVEGDNLSQSLKHILSPQQHGKKYRYRHILSPATICEGATNYVAKHPVREHDFCFLHFLFLSCVVIHNSMTLRQTYTRCLMGSIMMFRLLNDRFVFQELQNAEKNVF